MTAGDGAGSTYEVAVSTLTAPVDDPAPFGLLSLIAA